MKIALLKVGGLFSGIAGLELGFQRAGFQIDWMIEKDPFCQKVLAKNFPDVRRYEDVRQVGKHNLSAVDVIVGGAPCQPHSFAGKRRGAADDRDLWAEYKRVVTELDPTWLVFENVPGIASSVFYAGIPQVESKTLTRDKDQDIFTRIYTQAESLYLNHIKEDIENLGYEVAILYLSACGFNAPHKRERVFVVAHANGSRLRTLPRQHRESATTGATNSTSPRSQTLPNPHNQRRNGREAGSGQARGRLASDGGGGGNVADSNSQRQPQPQGATRDERGRAGNSGQDVPNANEPGLAQWKGQRENTRKEQQAIVRSNRQGGNQSGGGQVESRLGNSNDGISTRLARRGVENFWAGNWEEGIPRTVAESLSGRTNKLKALGNAVVPQLAEFIGRQMLAAIPEAGI